MPSTPCPICANENAAELPRSADACVCNCPRCGQFSISGTAVAVWAASEPSQRQIANASGWIHEHQGIRIASGDIAFLLVLEAPTVAQRADRLLLELARQFPATGQKMTFSCDNPVFLGVSWSETKDEVIYLACDYLNSAKGFLTSDRSMGYKLHNGQITPAGYSHLEEIRHSRVASNIGFCAMWFDEGVKPVWACSIEPAIRDAGYDPKRIDGHEHNNRIDDEILAMLRRSKFVIADFTGQRGGVYFESGFALGLGLPVVWTCAKEELEADKIHFDNRQYAFVTWEKDKLDDFKTRLQNRIEATIGRGPLVKA